MRLKDVPEAIRPFVFHGVDLSWSEGSDKTYGNCPFCNGDRKLEVSKSTGLWTCHRTKEKGNAIQFLRNLWALSMKATNDYSSLKENRGLGDENTLIQWGVARSITNGNWLVPGYNYQGNICQLYSYVSFGGDKPRLMATSGFQHGLFGRPLYSQQCSRVFLCEGPWDAMALWEALRSISKDKYGVRQTTNFAASFGSTSSILALPGGAFKKTWLPLFSDRIVYLCFDNDHPKVNEVTGKMLPPAGFSHLMKVNMILSKAKRPPTEIYQLDWGEGGYTPHLGDGYDVRDILNNPPE